MCSPFVDGVSFVFRVVPSADRWPDNRQRSPPSISAHLWRNDLQTVIPVVPRYVGEIFTVSANIMFAGKLKRIHAHGTQLMHVWCTVHRTDFNTISFESEIRKSITYSVLLTPVNVVGRVCCEVPLTWSSRSSIAVFAETHGQSLASVDANTISPHDSMSISHVSGLSKTTLLGSIVLTRNMSGGLRQFLGSA